MLAKLRKSFNKATDPFQQADYEFPMKKEFDQIMDCTEFTPNADARATFHHVNSAGLQVGNTDQWAAVAQNQGSTLPSAKELENKVMMVPMTQIGFDVEIQDTVAMLTLVQEYTFPKPQDEKATQNPIEVTYKFPKEGDTVVSRMFVSVDGNSIEAKIQKKKDAERIYNDAISKGNKATIMKEDQTKEFYQLDIGNVLPGQPVKIQVNIIKAIDCKDGAYRFSIPQAYFQDYDGSDSNQEINCRIRVSIKSKSSPVSDIQYPDTDFKKVYRSEDDHHVIYQKNKKDLSIPTDDLVFSFKTQDMDTPKFLFQRSPDFPGEVALCAQFLQTFQAKSENNKAEVGDQEIEEAEMIEGLDADHQYIFIVDRSYSMSGARIAITKEALKLFIQSLPEGSTFGIISFGSTQEKMVLNLSNQPHQKNESAIIYPYNNETKKEAIKQIEQMDANLGGTDIFTPLGNAFFTQGDGKKQRIFLLTDGQVHNRQEIVDLISNQCKASSDKNHPKAKDDVKVFTVGISDDCDAELCQIAANAGNGTCQLVGDKELTGLRGRVIKSLKNASDPALQNCIWMWNKEEGTRLDSLFRNDMVRDFKIVSSYEFEHLQCTFESDFDPVSKQEIKKTFEKAEFKQFVGIEGQNELFKLCTKRNFDLGKIKKEDIVDASVKYQVLTKETAFVGVIKTKEDLTGAEEMKNVEIPTVKNGVENKPKYDPYNYSGQKSHQTQYAYNNTVTVKAKKTATAPPQSQAATFYKSSGDSIHDAKYQPGYQAGQDTQTDYVWDGVSPINDMTEFTPNKEKVITAMKNKKKKIQKPNKKLIAEKKAEEEQLNIEVVKDEDAKKEDKVEESSKVEELPKEQPKPKEEEKKAEAPKVYPIQPKGKHSMDDIITLQESGCWNQSTSKVLETFFQESEYKSWCELKGKHEDIGSVLMTLLAISILSIKFKELADEWEMIVKKGKTYIKKAKVDKSKLDEVNQLLKKFKY